MTDALFSLDNRVIVITGAAGLLGQQHTEVVARAGGIPVLLDIRDTAVQTLADQTFTRFGVPATGWAVDITCEAEVAANCSSVLARYGHIDGLINNAANNPKVEDEGTRDFSRLEYFPLERWQADLAVGLTGAFLCAKHYGPAIAQNSAGGSIVNISSDLGVIAPDQRLYRKEGIAEDEQPVKSVSYSVVKHGLIGLTKYLSTYWADRNIRIIALSPGGVHTD